MSLVLGEQGAAGEKSCVNRRTEVRRRSLQSILPSLLGSGGVPAPDTGGGRCSRKALDGPCPDWMANLQVEPGRAGNEEQSLSHVGEAVMPEERGQRTPGGRKGGALGWGRTGRETALPNPQAPSQHSPWENQQNRTPWAPACGDQGPPRRAWSEGLPLMPLRSNTVPLEGP